MRLRASCRAPGLATRAAAVALCLAALAPSRAAGDEAGPHLKAAWPGAEDKEREELLRAQRMGRSLALLLLDVDHLKQMNDTFGHAAGDQLLRAVVDVLRSRTRGIDLAARLGGDEFILILPETDRAGAMVARERLMEGIAEQRIHGQSIQISAGVAVYPDDGRTEKDLRQNADDDLYQNKRRRQ